MAVSTISNAPSISMSINLEPPIYEVGDFDVPTLSVTATLEGTLYPITLCIWHTILNIHQALEQRRFDIIDRNTGRLVVQTAKKSKRPPITRQLGTPDARLFLTLEPGVPHTVRGRFGPPADKMDITCCNVSSGAVFGARGLKKGKYTLRVTRDKGPRCEIPWWRYGTKEENLIPANVHGIDTSLNHSATPSPLLIDVFAIPPVEFEVVDAAARAWMSFARGENVSNESF